MKFSRLPQSANCLTTGSVTSIQRQHVIGGQNRSTHSGP